MSAIWVLSSSLASRVSISEMTLLLAGAPSSCWFIVIQPVWRHGLLIEALAKQAFFGPRRLELRPCRASRRRCTAGTASPGRPRRWRRAARPARRRWPGRTTSSRRPTPLLRSVSGLRAAVLLRRRRVVGRAACRQHDEGERGRECRQIFSCGHCIHLLCWCPGGRWSGGSPRGCRRTGCRWLVVGPRVGRRLGIGLGPTQHAGQLVAGAPGPAGQRDGGDDDHALDGVPPGRGHLAEVQQREQQVERDRARGGGEHPAASAAEHHTAEDDGGDGDELVALPDRGVYAGLSDQDDPGHRGGQRGEDERPGLDPPDGGAADGGGAGVVAGGDQRACRRAGASARRRTPRAPPG